MYIIKRTIFLFLFTIYFLLFFGISQAADAQVIISEDQNETIDITVNEGQTHVGNLKLSHAQGDIYMGISGGDDKDAFYINDEDALKFITAADYSYPTDADKNNVYQVTLTGKDNNFIVGQNMDVTVRDLKYPYSNNFINQRKDLPNKNKHNTWVCKNSIALNFNNVGIHKEELCLYENGVNNILAEAAEMLEEISRKVSAGSTTISTSTSSTNTEVYTPPINDSYVGNRSDSDTPVNPYIPVTTTKNESVVENSENIVIADTEDNLESNEIDKESKEISDEEVGEEDMDLSEGNITAMDDVSIKKSHWLGNYFGIILFVLALIAGPIGKLISRNDN